LTSFKNVLTTTRNCGFSKAVFSSKATPHNEKVVGYPKVNIILEKIVHVEHSGKVLNAICSS
jgi:hypothetical protein